MLLPGAAQDPDGTIVVELGAKGVVELELVSSGEVGTRPRATSIRAKRPASTVRRGTSFRRSTPSCPPTAKPAIPGFADKARALSAAEKAMIEVAAKRMDEAEQAGPRNEAWLRDVDWHESLEC